MRRWKGKQGGLRAGCRIGDGATSVRPGFDGRHSSRALQVAWQDLEFGVINHFSTNTFLNQEWGDGTANPHGVQPGTV